MIRASKLFAGPAIVLALATERSVGQFRPKVVRIPDGVSCATCRIAMSPIVMLRIPPDTTDGFPVSVSLDSLGRYWVLRSGDMPALFDSGGRFLGLLGRSGRGPGEYLSPYYALPIAKDSVLVLHGERRATVLNASLKPVRYLRLPFSAGSPVAIAWPKAVVASGTVPTADGAGLPLHVVTMDGPQAVVVRSFGPGDGEVRPDNWYTLRHSTSAASLGRFWSAATYSYDVYEWTASGSLVRAFERRPHWFSKPSPINYDWRKRPPPPHVSAIQRDSAGLVWVVTRTAGPSWRDGLARVPKDAIELPGRLAEREKLWGKTIIEVIDPERGRVVHRRSILGYAVALFANGRLALYEVDTLGMGRIALARLELARR